MVRRSAVFLVLAAIGLALAGCAHLDALVNAGSIEREMRVERLKFFEKLGDAYFILGYEYYCLAKEAEDRGQFPRAADYATRAKLYHVFCRDARAAARELRAALEGDEPGPGDEEDDPPPDQCALGGQLPAGASPVPVASY